MGVIVGFITAADATFGSDLNIDVTGWSASVATDVSTYELFGTQWKQAAAGTQQLTGSVTGIAEDDGALMSATHSNWTVSLALTMGGGESISCTAVLSNLSVSKTPGGNCEVTADFVSHDTITFGTS